MESVISVLLVAALAVYIMAILCKPTLVAQMYLVVPLFDGTAEMAIESAINCVPWAKVIALDIGNSQDVLIAQRLMRKYPYLEVANCDELHDMVDALQNKEG